MMILMIVGSKPENGKLYINKKGLTAMAVVINNKCYKKEFGGNLQIIDDSDCDLGYIGNDEVNPTIEFNVIGNPFNDNGWANQNFYVNINVIDNESGAYSYRWCSDINDCEPVTLVEASSGEILISTESVNTVVCAVGYDKAGNMSDKTCSDTYKLDKQNPILTVISEDIQITEGDSNIVSSYFNVSYGISGGNLSCTPENTSGLSVGNQTVTCTATGGNNLITILDKIIIVQENIYTDNSGANKPELYDKMIPVTWNGNSWVYADKSIKWYDYDTKWWANAVVLNNGVIKSVGQTISESEIAMMFVWIPRYKYRIFNGNNGTISPQLINIVFETGTAKTGTLTCTTETNVYGESSEVCSTITNGVSTYTHPAFTFGTQELTGIWVGKFENSAPNVVSNIVQKVIIKPNVESWRYTVISIFYQSIMNIKTDYGMNIDSHMMKNMEWGAVAYLSHSKYVRCTASGTCTEIAKNDSSDYYTGRSLGRPSSATGEYSTSGTYTYELPLGQLASTTGNIYGIYDMSGGAWEYVMGNMVNSSNGFYSSDAGFGSTPSSKYYDSYTYAGSELETHSRGKLGDATKEILKIKDLAGGWYNAEVGIIHETKAWFYRGGSYPYSSGAGIFAFHFLTGGACAGCASRAVLVAID